MTYGPIKSISRSTTERLDESLYLGCQCRPTECEHVYDHELAAFVTEYTTQQKNNYLEYI